MRERYLGMLAHKAETLRSAQSLPRTAAGAVALARRLPLPAQAEEEAASGQKEIRPVLRDHTARAEVVMVVHRQA